jgi:peptide/nickel transport system substrate-binding protein
VRARKAAAYAVDRGAIIGVAGGAAYAQPTCQVLPPNFPGYRPYCPHTQRPSAAGRWKAPDVARARALVTASRTRGARVVISVARRFEPLAQQAAVDLRRIGYRASLRVFPEFPAYYAYFSDSRNRAEAGVQAYGSDFPAPWRFVEQFTCRSFVPAATGAAFNGNLSQFCDPKLDRMAEHALELQVTDPPAANALWASIDRAIVDTAPVVPLFIPKNFDLVSKRVGNYQFSPQYGVLLSQLWVR